MKVLKSRISQIAILSILTISQVVANNCIYLYQNVKDDCEYGFNDGCVKLQYCQEKRTACPQELNGKSSCIDFNTCVDAFHRSLKHRLERPNLKIVEKVLLDPLNTCKYSYDERADKCINQNIYNTTTWEACPGKGGFLDKFADKDYNCEGQKERIKDFQQRCIDSLYRYRKECGNTVNGKPIPDEIVALSCPQILVKVPQTTDVNSEGARTQNTERFKLKPSFAGQIDNNSTSSGDSESSNRTR